MFFGSPYLFEMVGSDAKDCVVVIKCAEAIDHMGTHHRMKDIHMICIVNRSLDMKLIEIWHGHNDNFGIEERQDKGKEGVEVERFDFGGFFLQDGVKRIRSYVTQFRFMIMD